jgi:hypothetical protein
MKQREQQRLSKLHSWVSGRVCLFEQGTSLTGRVLLSATNNECAGRSSRTAGSKGKSRKVDENAEDLHDSSRGMVCVCRYLTKFEEECIYK